MDIRIETKNCTGCGACVEICPTGAIQMDGGLVVLNPAVCSQCQSCVDICLTGAINIVEFPQVIQPASPQLLPASKPVARVLVPRNQTTWRNMLLTYAGQEIMPRVIDLLISALEQRLLPAPSKRVARVSLGPTAVCMPLHEKGRGNKRRKRYGQAARKLGYRADGRK